MCALRTAGSMPSRSVPTGINSPRKTGSWQSASLRSCLRFGSSLQASQWIREGSRQLIMRTWPSRTSFRCCKPSSRITTSYAKVFSPWSTLLFSTALHGLPSTSSASRCMQRAPAGSGGAWLAAWDSMWAATAARSAPDPTPATPASCRHSSLSSSPPYPRVSTSGRRPCAW